MRYDLTDDRRKMDEVFDLLKEKQLEQNAYYTYWQIIGLEEETIAFIYDLLVEQWDDGYRTALDEEAERDAINRGAR